MYIAEFSTKEWKMMDLAAERHLDKIMDTFPCINNQMNIEKLSAAKALAFPNFKISRTIAAKVIPFRINKFLFERVKASGFNDRKWVHIDLILTHLRSLNRESLTQLKYLSEMVQL